jgi:hypothetical protein
MTPEEEALIEAVTTAYRARAPNGALRSHPAWHDLDEAGRRQAFARAVVQRELEAALDAEHLSTTARAVLGRIGRIER